MKVVIIIPTYNERKTVGNVIDRAEKVFSRIKNHSFGILVVDDNSPDGTASVVEKLGRKYGNIEILRGDKKGLGIAYARGMKYAMSKMKADVVFEMDADGQHDPKYIEDFMRKIDEGYDYVIGSRYIKGGSIPKAWGIHRKFLSFFGSLFARYALSTPDVKDYTGGYKASRVRGYLEKIDLDNLLSPRYAYKIHLLHEMLDLGAKTVEVPIHFKDRRKDFSKSTLRDFFDSLRVVVILRIRKSQRFIKVCIVGAAGAVVQFGFYFVLKGFVKDFNGVMVGSFHISQKGFFNAVAVEAAIITNFLINNLWTFTDKKIGFEKKALLKFLQFNFFVMGSLIIQAVVLEAGTRLIGVDSNAVDFGLISVGILLGLIYNFYIYKKVIWKTQK